MLEKGAFLFHFKCEKTWFLDKNFFHILSKFTLEGALHEKSTSGLEEGAFLILNPNYTEKKAPFCTKHIVDTIRRLHACLLTKKK